MARLRQCKNKNVFEGRTSQVSFKTAGEKYGALVVERLLFLELAPTYIRHSR